MPRSKRFHTVTRAGVVTLALLGAGCSDYVRQGTSPVQPVVMSLVAASGVTPGELAGTLNSDVITNVTRTINDVQVLVPTVFNDVGQVTMTLIMKDPGGPGAPNAPSLINQVTFTRYRVTYRRADGRNVAGVDVPFPFESAATFTVPASGGGGTGFEIVRHTAKQEAPLAALQFSDVMITTIADVQFFGQDQAGNAVTATGSIGIIFGNFGDPE